MSDVFHTAEDELNFILGNDSVNPNNNSDGPHYGGSYGGEDYPFFDDDNNFEYNASLQEAEEFAVNALGVNAAKPSPMMAINKGGGGSDDDEFVTSTHPSIISHISRMVSLSPPPAYDERGAPTYTYTSPPPIKHDDYTSDVGALMMLNDPPVMEDGRNDTLDAFKIDFKSLDDADDDDGYFGLSPSTGNDRSSYAASSSTAAGSSALPLFVHLSNSEQQHDGRFLNLDQFHPVIASHQHHHYDDDQASIVDAIMANLSKNSPPRNNSNNKTSSNDNEKKKKRKSRDGVRVPVVHRSIPPSSLVSGTDSSDSGGEFVDDKANKKTLNNNTTIKKGPPAATKRMPLRKRKVVSLPPISPEVSTSPQAGVPDLVYHPSSPGRYDEPLIQRFLSEPWLDFEVMDYTMSSTSTTTLYPNVNPCNTKAKEARRIRRLKRAKGQVVQLVTCGRICGNGTVRDVEVMAVQDVLLQQQAAAANLNGSDFSSRMLDLQDSSQETTAANLNGNGITTTLEEDQQVQQHEEQMVCDFTKSLDCKTFVDSAWGYVYSNLVEIAQQASEKKKEEKAKKMNMAASSSPKSSASMIDEFLLASDATTTKMDVDTTTTDAKNRVVVTPPSTPRNNVVVSSNSSNAEILKRAETLKTLPSGKDPESRKLRRLMRNRLSAQASRDRRKKAIEDAKKLKIVKEQQISTLKDQVDVDTKRMVLLERAVRYAKTYLGAEEYDRVVGSNNTPATTNTSPTSAATANTKKSNIIQSV